MRAGCAPLAAAAENGQLAAVERVLRIGKAGSKSALAVVARNGSIEIFSGIFPLVDDTAKEESVIALLRHLQVGARRMVDYPGQGKAR
jgi:hypothetical protein